MNLMVVKEGVSGPEVSDFWECVGVGREVVDPEPVEPGGAGVVVVEVKAELGKEVREIRNSVS